VKTYRLATCEEQGSNYYSIGLGSGGLLQFRVAFAAAVPFFG